jgi:hypothetical protein
MTASIRQPLTLLEASMSDTFDKLKALLDTKGNLTEEDIAAMIAERGPLSEDERAKLEAERYEKQRAKDQKITLDEYLAASKVLDTAAEGSDEYNQALKLVEAYESGN